MLNIFFFILFVIGINVLFFGIEILLAYKELKDNVKQAKDVGQDLISR